MFFFPSVYDGFLIVKQTFFLIYFIDLLVAVDLLFKFHLNSWKFEGVIWVWCFQKNLSLTIRFCSIFSPLFLSVHLPRGAFGQGSEQRCWRHKGQLARGSVQRGARTRRPNRRGVRGFWAAGQRSTLPECSLARRPVGQTAQQGSTLRLGQLAAAGPADGAQPFGLACEQAYVGAPWAYISPFFSCLFNSFCLCFIYLISACSCRSLLDLCLLSVLLVLARLV